MEQSYLWLFELPKECAAFWPLYDALEEKGDFQPPHGAQRRSIKEQFLAGLAYLSKRPYGTEVQK